MSAKNKVRLVWSFPAVLLASWLAVRTLAASPDSPPAKASFCSAGTELSDPSLHRLIGRFAEEARDQQRSSR
jgi:hypothetical protein